MGDIGGQVYTVVPKDECCGCGACCAGCPTGAIRMEPDGEGFLYPVMADKSLCTDCGKCARVCPVLRAKDQKADRAEEGPAFYAVVNNDREVLAASSSGGAFTLFAQKILSEGGAVFGAALSADCRKVEHICVEDEVGLEKLRRSKYVQSDMGTCYQQAEKLLKAGRQVLFTGTACQIEGLKGFLGEDYPGLWCADIICFGVPSPKLWERYIHYREEQTGAPVRKVIFRDKISGWANSSLTVEFAGGDIHSEKQSENLYMRAFQRRIALRPCCYQCSFKGTCRIADVTIGDLWGLNAVLPEWNDDKGVSLLMVRGDRGQTLFEQVKENCRWQAIDGEEALRHNPMAVKSASRPPRRDKVFRKLDRMSFDLLIQKYSNNSATFRRRVWRVLHRLGLC